MFKRLVPWAGGLVYGAAGVLSLPCGAAADEPARGVEAARSPGVAASAAAPQRVSPYLRFAQRQTQKVGAVAVSPLTLRRPRKPGAGAAQR